MSNQSCNECGAPKVFVTGFNAANLTPADCVLVFQCIIDHGTPAQFDEFCASLGLTLNVSAGPDGVIGNATSSELLNLCDEETLHFWSNDQSILFTVAPGSALVEAHVNPLALTGLAHTAITNIDLRPALDGNGNPLTGVFTVEVTWTDEDGDVNVTTDPTPITIDSDTHGTVVPAGHAVTNVTTNGIQLGPDTPFVAFPDGSTWAHPIEECKCLTADQTDLGAFANPSPVAAGAIGSLITTTGASIQLTPGAAVGDTASSEDFAFNTGDPNCLVPVRVTVTRLEAAGAASGPTFNADGTATVVTRFDHNVLFEILPDACGVVHELPIMMTAASIQTNREELRFIASHPVVDYIGGTNGDDISGQLPYTGPWQNSNSTDPSAFLFAPSSTLSFDKDGDTATGLLSFTALSIPEPYEFKLCDLPGLIADGTISDGGCTDIPLTKLVTDASQLDMGNADYFEWQDTAPATPEPFTFEAYEALADAHDYGLTPDISQTISTLSNNDTANVSNELSITVVDAWVFTPVDVWLRWAFAGEGGIRAELFDRCTDNVTDSVDYYRPLNAPDTHPGLLIPAGTHRLRTTNVDSGGSASDWVVQWSADGNTYANGEGPDLTLSLIHI